MITIFHDNFQGAPYSFIDFRYVARVADSVQFPVRSDNSNSSDSSEHVYTFCTRVIQLSPY